ncbi:conserved hypothetical protein [Pyrobaculum islandicum DSM 4184]|uniref:Uncharacterized protein n=1 Tax=Pyrobaculum islandicum (strain DSM 4184 / JCM 9189 / GEO3) TaxID=384616 RepID=A1RRS9_PYRIL|nr:hypothetical protein [Pyrobaculum islandicum]ABL87661.1 conserved hypothetical protein [Pyrobaculum islandicum DSM 4184]
MLIRVNLLETLGAGIGYFGEYIFAKVLQKVSRGETIAMLVEGLYSADKIAPRGTSMPHEKGRGVYSKHVLSEWPIHKSWFVPVVEDGAPAVILDPPRGLVKYIGRDTEGVYALLLSLGLKELKDYVLKGVSPTLLKDFDIFTETDIEIAAVIYERLRGEPDFVASVIETLREVDFLLVENGVVYHVEVKTTMRPTDPKLRKKRTLLQKRQQIMEKLGLRPALAVVIPRENWEVEVWFEKS